MTKEEALKAFKLISALESWALSTKQTMPAFFDVDLNSVMAALERIILEKNT